MALSSNTNKAAVQVKPCKKHGLVERNKWGKCKVCRREENKKYRAENAEKVRESIKKHYAENAEKELERNKKWRTKNPEKVREKNKKWCAENSKNLTDRYVSKRIIDILSNHLKRRIKQSDLDIPPELLEVKQLHLQPNDVAIINSFIALGFFTVCIVLYYGTTSPIQCQ